MNRAALLAALSVLPPCVDGRELEAEDEEGPEPPQEELLLGRDDVSRALQVLHGARRDATQFRVKPEACRKRPLDLFTKDHGYRGKQHCAYMRCGKKIRTSELRINDMQMDSKVLEDAWNHGKVREGDKVGESAELKTSHPNRYDPEALILYVFRMIGNGRMDRDGIGGSHCGMDIIISVASALRSFQAKWFSEKCAELVGTSSVICMQRQ